MEKTERLPANPPQMSGNGLGVYHFERKLRAVVTMTNELCELYLTLQREGIIAGKKDNKLSNSLTEAIRLSHGNKGSTADDRSNDNYVPGWANSKDTSFENFASYFVSLNDIQRKVFAKSVQAIHKENWQRTLPIGDIVEYILNFQNTNQETRLENEVQ
jgi:hypothetical protein